MENSESQNLTEARKRASPPFESRDRQSVTREWQASVGRGAWSGLGNPFDARFARAWLVHGTRRRKRGGERKKSANAPQYFHTWHTRTCSLRYLQLRPSSSSLPKNGRSEIESFFNENPRPLAPRDTEKSERKNKLILAGGEDGKGNINSVWIYDIYICLISLKRRH